MAASSSTVTAVFEEEDCDSSQRPCIAVDSTSARRLSATSDHDDSDLAALRASSMAAKEAEGRWRKNADALSHILPSVRAVLGKFLRGVVSRTKHAARTPGLEGHPARLEERNKAGTGSQHHISSITKGLNGHAVIFRVNTQDDVGIDQAGEIGDLASETDSVQSRPASPVFSVGKSDKSTTASPSSSTKSKEDRVKDRLPLRVPSNGPPTDAYLLSSGLVKWEFDDWADEDPDWISEPDITIIGRIARKYLRASGFAYDDLSVQFLAEGRYSKVFVVTLLDSTASPRNDLIFRIPLVIDPYYKIESDVATTEYVRRFTSIPAPRIFAFDSSTNNELGMEWMLMERIHGTTVYDLWGEEWDCTKFWDDVDWEAKTAMSKQVAYWTHELSCLRFDQIGSLYIDWARSTFNHPEFFIGRCVEIEFVRGQRLRYKIERGPFNSVQSYLQSLIDFALCDVQESRQWKRLQQADKPNPNDGLGYKAHHLEKIPPVCKALTRVLPKMFPPGPLAPKTTMLHHFDMSDLNVMVDKQGAVTGVLDWELTVTRPANLLFYGVPKIILSNGDADEPYSPETDKPDSEHIILRATDDYYKTILRRMFREHLEELQSPWLRILDHDTSFLDFDDKPWEAQIVQMIEKVPRHWASGERRVIAAERNIEFQQSVETDGDVENGGYSLLC
ncbi:MAG: hypothetical protein M1812_005409 [Candelaria pacifica]|nr:MAG: hypothetical protein M1812_005409 [Candelaria pacifica]